jgi:small subunit ribosomal protein S19e
MSHLVDLPPATVLPRIAAELRGRPGMTPPPWAAFVKTGAHKQRAPSQPDWWYLRCASVLRKIATRGPTGVTRISAQYGGRRDRGSAPYHAVGGSRSIAREILQQLEKAGLVRVEKLRGRRVTAAGQKMLDGISREVLQALAAQRPELAKYL